jgi:hypothetical protein
MAIGLLRKLEMVCDTSIVAMHFSYGLVLLATAAYDQVVTAAPHYKYNK